MSKSKAIENMVSILIEWDKKNPPDTLWSIFMQLFKRQ